MGKHALSQHTFWNFWSKIHSFHHLSVILDCFIWSYRTKSRNIQLYNFSVYCDMFNRIYWGLTLMCQSWTHLLFCITSLYPIWKYLMAYFSGYYLIWPCTSHIRAFKLSVTYTIILFSNLWNYHNLVQR